MVKKGEGSAKKTTFSHKEGEGKGLSNEVLNFDFSPGAAKISKVKVEGKKK